MKYEAGEFYLITDFALYMSHRAEITQFIRKNCIRALLKIDFSFDAKSSFIIAWHSGYK